MKNLVLQSSGLIITMKQIYLFTIKYYFPKNLTYKWSDRIEGKKLKIRVSKTSTEMRDFIEIDYQDALNIFKSIHLDYLPSKKFNNFAYPMTNNVIYFLPYITKLSYYKHHNSENIMSLFHNFEIKDLLNRLQNERGF